MHLSMIQFLLWGTGLLFVASPQIEHTFLLPAPTGMTAIRALNLHGPVMAVSTERAVFANGKEGKRQPFGLFTFDTHGYLTLSKIYAVPSTEATPAAVTTFTCNNTYDAQGRLSMQDCTITDHGKDGTFLYSFTYDAQGRLAAQHMTMTPPKTEQDIAVKISETCTLDDAGRISKQLLDMLEGHKRVQATISYAYQPTETTAMLQISEEENDRTQFCYDAQGRLTQIGKSSHGTVSNDISFQYNDHGDVSRQISRAGTISAYNYTYDAHGNWTRCVESTVSQKNGKEVLTPKEATYQALVYAAPATGK